MSELSGNLDPQTIWMTAILVCAFFGMRYVVPRLVAGVPFTEPKVIHDRMAAGEDLVVIDVRSPGEFTGGMGHVPGSVNVPLGDLASRLHANAAEMEGLKVAAVFVMCRTNNRSPTAARLLRKRGFTNVQVVKGGLNAWKRAGLPIEKS